MRQSVVYSQSMLYEIIMIVQAEINLLNKVETTFFFHLMIVNDFSSLYKKIINISMSFSSYPLIEHKFRERITI